MKILPQFIPLIVSGEKAYELRNDNDNFDKYYLIDNHLYFLESYKAFQKSSSELFSEANDYFLKNTSTGTLIPITKPEYEWLHKNWDTYFTDNVIYIAAWYKAHFPLGNLEVFDYRKNN